MYSANTQNTLLRLRGELNQCYYSPQMKNYISNLIYTTMNYPKKNCTSTSFYKKHGI